MLKAFLTSLPAADQATVSREAKTMLLKNPGDWLAGYRVPAQNNDQEGEQEEEEDLDRAEEDTVVMERTVVIAKRISEMMKIMVSFPHLLSLQETP